MIGKYDEFLATKLHRDPPTGLVDGFNIHDAQFGYQRDITRWALRRGRAAIFADCGLGKTLMQIDWARAVAAHTSKPVLVLCPLAVTHQTKREGDLFDIPVHVCRKQSDVRRGVNVVNYEMIDHFDPLAFGGIVLDESSILKSFAGKYRNQIIESFSQTPFRLACTATPSPNDWMELGNHSEFLGVMTRQVMLATFFVHDGGRTSQWRLKGHAESEFWRWVCSWAVMTRRPSDLGYSDDGFALPSLSIHQVEVDSGIKMPGMMFSVEAKTLIERRQARKVTTQARCEKAADLVKERGGKWVLWCGLNYESDTLARLIPGAVEVRGSMSPDEKSDRLNGFSSGKFDVLVTKPSIAGFGLNWQHCNQMAFVGLSDSFEKYYQAVRRCWRFGQTSAVDVWIITADIEGAVVTNIKRKESEANEMGDRMVSTMKEQGLSTEASIQRAQEEYTTDSVAGGSYRLHKGDCVDVVSEMDSDSIHYSIFSPPFASLYTYTNSNRDMGNCANHAEFFAHFEFLVGELLRVTMPGRLLSFHCMNLPTSKVRDGVIGLTDFRGQLIRMFTDAGWIYHSEVCIWKDPVTAMQRTKALGLLYKQLRKDSCMSRQGIADYLVTMRKPGDNPERVTHTHDSFPVSVWQRYASPVWSDINPSRTLQYRSARDDADERHICPLQLDVIERAIRLWSNPDDLILSPFAGIGSEGYVALNLGRRFVGVELKQSYYDQAKRNLARAQRDQKQLNLFGESGGLI